ALGRYYFEPRYHLPHRPPALAAGHQRRTDRQNTKGLVQTQITSATDCLFAAAAGRSLIHLDGIDQPGSYFAWAENRNNLFSKFNDRFLDQQAPMDELMPPRPYDRSQWESV